jgi:hypothetical protein
VNEKRKAIKKERNCKANGVGTRKRKEKKLFITLKSTLLGKNLR